MGAGAGGRHETVALTASRAHRAGTSTDHLPIEKEAMKICAQLAAAACLLLTAACASPVAPEAAHLKQHVDNPSQAPMQP